MMGFVQSPRRRGYVSLLCLLGLVGVVAQVALGGCGEEFSAGGGGGGGTPTATTSTPTGTGGTETTSTPEGGTGGSPNGGGPVGGSGGAPEPCHLLCDEGAAVAEWCDPCLDLVCASTEDPACCNTLWNAACVASAEEHCRIDCDGAHGSPLTCHEQYGSVPHFKNWCMVSDATCVFVHDNSDKTCDSLCGDKGGLCVNAEQVTGACASAGVLDCSELAPPPVKCVCTHGCNLGPPCEYPATCHVDGCY